MVREPCLSSLCHVVILPTALVFLSHFVRPSAIPVKFELPDNTAANTPLGNISSRSKAIPLPISSRGYYRVIINPNRFADRYFRVDRHSGLFAKTDIDRDEVCRQFKCCRRLICKTSFTVFIGLSASRSERVNVTIVLHDENDNAPTIQTEEISLPESTKISSTRPLPVATDRDSDANGVKNYELIDSTDTFSMRYRRNKKPLLVVLKQLDAEKIHEYDLDYSAQDGGIPSKVGKVRLKIKVMDENDNAPKFKTEAKTKWIYEDTPVGKKVFHFEAIDQDIDPDNRRITYHLNTIFSKPKGLAERNFEVNALTGDVFVTAPLDYDKLDERTYALVVEARDGGSPSLTSTCTLSVILSNVNDNDPKITVTNSQPLLEENSSPQRVRTISVSDDDDLSSVHVNCTLINSPGFFIQIINENHYFDVVTMRRFDYETSPEVQVTIACTELKKPFKTVHETLIIPVVDINDHSPTFQYSEILKSLAENAPLGTEVMTVKASDEDKGKDGEIRYSLDSFGSSYFEIDPLRGTLYVNASLDREVSSLLRFKVVAKDLGTPQRSSDITILLNLTDVNDNAPTLRGPKAIDVVENIRPGTVIAKVEFDDPDAGPNGNVTFRLIRDNNLSLKYLNMSNNGDIVVVSPIDREVTSRMYLDIQARDKGTPVLETTVSLIIRVLDLNDNRPRLVTPAPYSTVSGVGGRRIYANSPFNTTVTFLTVKDGDLRENGTIVYDIIDTNATGMFRVNRRTGRVYTGWKPPSQPGHGIYKLQVRFSDRGRPSLYSRYSLFVQVRPHSNDPMGIENSEEEGMSKIIILVLVLIATVAMATTVLMAFLWARSRSKRSTRNRKRPSDYGEYDPAVKQGMAETELGNNMDGGMSNGGVGIDPMADGTSSMTRSQKSQLRATPGQYSDFTNPYIMTSTLNNRDQRTQHGYESYGQQSPNSPSFTLENYGTTGRPTATSPMAHQQKAPLMFQSLPSTNTRQTTTLANPHLLSEMFEDDPRQSELSYDDSGKGGSLDDVGRLVLGQHVTSATSVMGFSHHPTMSRMTLRSAHPGGPGHLAEGGEETMC